MQQQMHANQRVQSRADVVDYDACAFRKLLQPSYWKRLQDVEYPKKYKARQKRFPSQGSTHQSDQLSGDFIDHDELRVLAAAGAGNRSCRGYSYQYCHNCGQNCGRSMP
jgi:hypothetical protein